MLEKPVIPDNLILTCLRVEYGLDCRGLTFLPIGVDEYNALFRAEACEGRDIFVKVRKGEFNQNSVRLPHLLNRQGITGVIAPLKTKKKTLYARMASLTLAALPFIDGADGYACQLTENQWQAFGKTVRALHSTSVPKVIRSSTPRETFSEKARTAVLEALHKAEAGVFHDQAARDMAALVRINREVLARLVGRSIYLAKSLQSSSPAFVLCHGDLHPGNLHICPSGEVFLVDWDNPVYSLRERDLILIGGGGQGAWNGAAEKAAFFAGYGPVQLNPEALAYFRCERILEDTEAFCHQVWASEDGGSDRAQAVMYLSSCFVPGGAAEAALQTGMSAS